MTFHDCENGKGSILVVNGPVAIGKSTLLHKFADHALQADATVLTATASVAERDMPFAILAQIFEPLSRQPQHRDVVNRLFGTDVCATALSDGPASEVEAAYAEVFHTLWVMLSREAAQRPVVIIVDDVHHADENSLRGLLFLARRLKLVRCLMVLAEQSRPHVQRGLFYADLFSQSHCRRVRLGTFSVDGVAGLLRDRGIDADREGLADACYDATGGNPMLAAGIIDDLVKSGSAASAGPVMPSPLQLSTGAFGEAVAACVHRSEPVVRRVAEAIAVLGEPHSAALIATVLDLDEATVRRCVNTLATSGLLNGWRYRHGAAALAVLSQVAPAESGRLHLLAARSLSDNGAPHEAVARHLLAAGGPAPLWAATKLREAAADALQQDRREIAVRYLELALDTADDPAERAAVTTRLAMLEWRVDVAVAGRRLPPLLAAMGEGVLAQRDAATLLRLLLWQGRLSEAEEILPRFAALPESDDPMAVAELRFLRIWLASVHPWHARHLAGVRPDGAEPATAMAVRESAPYQASELLAAVLAGDVDKTLVHRAEQLLERSPLDDATLEPLVSALTVLICVDHIGVAAYWCDILLARAEQLRAPIWSALLSSCRAEIAFRQGNLTQARQYARTALAAHGTGDNGVSTSWPLAVLLLAATESGDLAEAADVLARPLPAGLLESRFGAHFLYARGYYYLAKGWYELAYQDFRICGDLLIEWRLDVPGLMPWRAGLAETLLRMGDPGGAARLAEEQLSLARDMYPRAAGMALRVLAMTSKPAVRPGLLTESAERLRGVGDRLQLARTLAELSVAHAQTGRPDVGRRINNQARGLAQQCDAEPLSRDPAAARGRSEAPALSAGRPGVPAVRVLDMLSDSERRVAALAAQGHTNRQIARRLFITVSTVEQHLTSTYRKLNVNKRAELPSRLALVVVEAEGGLRRAQSDA